MPEISDRGRRMPASPIRKLMPFADEAKRRGIHVYHLNIGQPDIETPAAMRKILSKIDDRVLAYTPSGGTAAYLGSIQLYYKGLGIKLELGEIIATTGGSEALLFSLMAICDQGDEVIVIEPFYTNYSAFAAMAGARLVPVTSSAMGGFRMPAREEWERVITSRTRAVIICNPNNPTGTVYRPDELQQVAEICRDHDLFLISDEVYREFVYDGLATKSALQLEGIEDRVIVVDSLSKRYSACGIRLGAMVTRNREVSDAALRMAQGRLSAPGLAQMIAVGAVDVGEAYTRKVVEEYQLRRDILFKGLTSIKGVEFCRPEGAFYFIARLPVDDSEDFAQWILSEFNLDGRTVMVAPAQGFYATPGLGRNEIRIAYVLKEEDLVQSVVILEAALRQYCMLRGPAGTEQVVPEGEQKPDFHLPAES